MMQKGMETALLVVLVILVIVAIWYFFLREKKCKTNKDCQASETCTNGYCKATAAATKR